MNIYMMKKPKRINSVSVTLFLMAAAAGYLGWANLPIWWPAFQMTGIMRGICNDAYHESDPEKLMRRLVSEARRTGFKISADNFKIKRVPFTPDEMMKAETEHLRSIMAYRGKACIVTFHYEDNFVWPLIEKPRRVVVDREIRSEMETVSWTKDKNKACTCVTTAPER
jgi:hypothetical protein